MLFFSCLFECKKCDLNRHLIQISNRAMEWVHKLKSPNQYGALRNDKYPLFFCLSFSIYLLCVLVSRKWFHVQDWNITFFLHLSPNFRWFHVVFVQESCKLGALLWMNKINRYSIRWHAAGPTGKVISNYEQSKFVIELEIRGMCIKILASHHRHHWFER